MNVATVLADMPLALIISPLVGVWLTLRAWALLHAAFAAEQRALLLISAAVPRRMLHLAAWWNLAALPGYILGFVILLAPSVNSVFASGVGVAVVPACAIWCKLLSSRAIQVLSATTGLSAGFG